MPEELFEMQPELTGVALAYRNKGLIADEVFPSVPVEQKSFQYRFYNKTNFLTAPETLIGDKGVPNNIELRSKLLTETCENHSLKDSIPVTRLNDAVKSEKKIDLKAASAMQLSDSLKLSREVNLAKKLSLKTNYGANYKTLNAKEKFNLDDVNALKIVCDAIDEVFYKPNTMVLSRKAMSALRRNPYIVDAVKGSYVKAGVASYEGLKELFELDKILVGEGVVNTSKKKEEVSLQPCWGNNIILMHTNPVANTEYGVTFGYKAEYETLQIGSYLDPEPGLKGCEVLKGYESYIDLITCPECGYLLEGVI